jgi:hypothetical protein
MDLAIILFWGGANLSFFSFSSLIIIKLLKK